MYVVLYVCGIVCMWYRVYVILGKPLKIPKNPEEMFACYFNIMVLYVYNKLTTTDTNHQYSSICYMCSSVKTSTTLYYIKRK